MTNEECLVEERRVLGIIRGKKRNWLGNYMRQTQGKVMLNIGRTCKWEADYRREGKPDDCRYTDAVS